MLPTKSYAAQAADAPLAPFNIERRQPGPNDVLINIEYCGVCHSDLHQARNDWQNTMYPVVPGHEIVGRVAQVGSAVTKFKVGDAVGVGCLVDSCMACAACGEGNEHFCAQYPTPTYNGYERGTKTVTYGGYSDKIVVRQEFVVRVPDNLSLAGVAPLLCAGITTYSPLRHWKVGKGQQVGVVGLGGLGHMGVKLAAAMGAEVTMISSSASKKADAARLGAADFIASSDPEDMKRGAERFDLILNTISASVDYNQYLGLLKRDATMVMLGVPDKPMPIMTGYLLMRRRRIAGSMIGGIPETQEMLDFCGQHNITSDIEMIAMKDINQAYERMLKSDVRYRFVIDMKTL